MTEELSGSRSRGRSEVSAARRRLTELLQQSDAEIASLSPGEIRSLCRDSRAQLDALTSEVGELSRREVATL